MDAFLEQLLIPGHDIHTVSFIGLSNSSKLYEFLCQLCFFLKFQRPTSELQEKYYFRHCSDVILYYIPTYQQLYFLHLDISSFFWDNMPHPLLKYKQLDTWQWAYSIIPTSSSMSVWSSQCKSNCFSITIKKCACCDNGNSRRSFYHSPKVIMRFLFHIKYTKGQLK